MAPSAPFRIFFRIVSVTSKSFLISILLLISLLDHSWQFNETNSFLVNEVFIKQLTEKYRTNNSKSLDFSEFSQFYSDLVGHEISVDFSVESKNLTDCLDKIDEADISQCLLSKIGKSPYPIAALHYDHIAQPRPPPKPSSSNFFEKPAVVESKVLRVSVKSNQIEYTNCEENALINKLVQTENIVDAVAGFQPMDILALAAENMKMNEEYAELIVENENLKCSQVAAFLMTVFYKLPFEFSKNRSSLVFL